MTMKLPAELASWLERESKKAGLPKSALVRDILNRHKSNKTASAYDLAADLCGCVNSGLRDLSRNKKYLRGYGK